MQVTTKILTPNLATLAPALADIYAYWEYKSQSRLAPAWSEFRLEDLNARVISLAAVVEVTRQPLDFIYRYWGTAKTVLNGSDYHGHHVSEIQPKASALKLHGEFSHVAKKRQPFLFLNRIVGGQDEDAFCYLRLPLSTDAHNIDRIFSIGEHNLHVENQFRKMEQNSMFFCSHLIEESEQELAALY